MISLGIDSDAMRIGIDLEVGQPKIRLGIDDAHHRIGEHVARREIVFVIARVVPGLVHAPDLRDFQAVGEQALQWRGRYSGVRRYAVYAPACGVGDDVLVRRK